MKKIFFSLIIGLVTICIVSNTASAATFNPNNIMSDAVFDNTSTMSAAQIDAFLNQFPSSCISPNRGFQAIDPNGYSPSNGYQYGGFVNAGTVIYDAAQAYGINPQVLLATLQKEQSLVTGTAGCAVKRYAAAVGYGCPDSGGGYSYSNVNLYSMNGTIITAVDSTCVNSAAKVGFSQQVIRAAWLLKFGQQRSRGNIGWAVIKGNWNNSDDPRSCYSGPMTQGTYAVCPNSSATYYDGYRTIDGNSVHMDTGATAAFYWYTPHISGNQNFTNIFTGWFGSPHLIYSWATVNQQAFYDFKRTPADLGKLGPGQRYYLVVTVKNTGNVTWQREGPNPVNLGTVGPQDRASPFCDSTWVNAAPGCNRAAPLHEYSVAPGQYGSFEFWVTTPSNALGSYNEVYAPVMEGITWMNTSTVSFPMVVHPPTYSGAVTGQYAWTNSSKTQYIDINHLAPGQRYYVGITLKNTGDVTWTKNTGSYAVNLGTVGPRDRNSPFCDSATWISCNRAAALHEYAVNPGQTGSFEFWATAPSTGSFSESFQPVVEGKDWVDAGPMSFTMHVNPYSWVASQPQLYADSSKNTPVDSGQLDPGQRYYAVVNIQNRGTAAWQRLGTNPIALSTAAPQDHASPFCDTTWISCNRAAALHEYAVNPGQTGSFEFWAKAPSTVGSYAERFTPLVEGLTGMGSNTIDLSISVNKPRYAWSVIAQYAYTNNSKQVSQSLNKVYPGQRYYLAVTVRNDSNVTWTKGSGSFPASLGTASPRDRNSPFCDTSTWFDCKRAAQLHEYSVAPGQYGSFEFWVTAPASQGDYNEIYAPLIDGITWMDSHTVSFPMSSWYNHN